jgi:hypothetical protein
MPLRTEPSSVSAISTSRQASHCARQMGRVIVALLGVNDEYRFARRVGPIEECTFPTPSQNDSLPSEGAESPRKRHAWRDGHALLPSVPGSKASSSWTRSEAR